MYQKFDIVLVDLNPVKGSEQAGIRPCIIIQNNRANKASRTFVIAIISSTIKEYPHTVIVQSSKHNGLKNESRIDLLQVRTADTTRIIKNIGTLETSYHHQIDRALSVAFDV